MAKERFIVKGVSNARHVGTHVHYNCCVCHHYLLSLCLVGGERKKKKVVLMGYRGGRVVPLFVFTHYSSLPLGANINVKGCNVISSDVSHRSKQEKQVKIFLQSIQAPSKTDF
jgi:hypothetical protein